MVNLEVKQEILDTIPHGSGIDDTWRIEYKRRGRVCLTNSYHCMDSYGFYDGWADFSIVADVGQPHDFRLVFHGRSAQYLNRKHMLRDYLEDMFAEWLNS